MLLIQIDCIKMKRAAADDEDKPRLHPKKQSPKRILLGGHWRSAPAAASLSLSLKLSFLWQFSCWKRKKKSLNLSGRV